jgi:hypothetical protein
MAAGTRAAATAQPGTSAMRAATVQVPPTCQVLGVATRRGTPSGAPGPGGGGRGRRGGQVGRQRCGWRAPAGGTRVLAAAGCAAAGAQQRRSAAGAAPGVAPTGGQCKGRAAPGHHQEGGAVVGQKAAQAGGQEAPAPGGVHQEGGGQQAQGQQLQRGREGRAGVGWRVRRGLLRGQGQRSGCRGCASGCALAGWAGRRAGGWPPARACVRACQNRGGGWGRCGVGLARGLCVCVWEGGGHGGGGWRWPLTSDHRPLTILARGSARSGDLNSLTAPCSSGSRAVWGQP